MFQWKLTFLCQISLIPLLHFFLLFNARASASTTELRDSFYSNVDETQSELSNKTGAILYQSDLMYWSIMDGSDETRFIDSPDFSNFMALSHAPVTMATILLPDLLRSGYSLPNGIGNSTRRRLENFRGILQAAKSNFSGTVQRSLADDILDPVSKFIDDILSDQAVVNMQQLQTFASGLEGALRRAAEMALQDYFTRLVQLTDRLNRGFNWSVVLAVNEFSYNGSFLHQFYERVFFTVLLGRSDSYVQKRISLVPGVFCNCNLTAAVPTDLASQLSGAASNQIYRSEIYSLFNYGNSIHSILSDAADEVICSRNFSDFRIKCPVAITFMGFQTILERVFVILVVIFFSAALFLLVVVISIFSEDRVMKMENSSMDMPKKKKKKSSHSLGPNLLEPISDVEGTSSQVAYRDLKKKHSTSDRTDGDGRNSPQSPVQNGFTKPSRRSRYSQFHNTYNDDNEEQTQPCGITQTDVTFDDLTEF